MGGLCGPFATLSHEGNANIRLREHISTKRVREITVRPARVSQAGCRNFVFVVRVSLSAPRVYQVSEYLRWEFHVFQVREPQPIAPLKHSREELLGDGS